MVEAQKHQFFNIMQLFVTLRHQRMDDTHTENGSSNQYSNTAQLCRCIEEKPWGSETRSLRIYN